jgi:hypothetical protein
MSKGNGNNSSPLNWRDINQSRRKRPTTSVARQRKWGAVLRVSAALGVVFLFSGALIWGIYFGRPVVDKIQVAAPAQTLRTIAFTSDGVLSRDWFLANFPDVMSHTPLSVNIHELKRSLEANGQIRSAEVSIALPDSLRINIQERQPVLRARLRNSEGRVQTLMIARDGTVYEGHGYPHQMVIRLPAAADLRLRRSNEQFLPVAGMDIVADLLEQAKREVPHLYNSWQAVHFGRFQDDLSSPGALIKISSRNVDTIVFAPYHFEDQLMRLNEVVNYALQQRKPAMRSIDLSFREQAIVQFN